MLISNIQDNLIKSPIVAAAQSASDEHAKTENNVLRNDALELARKAEEEVKDTKQAENEIIREEKESAKDTNPDEQKKERREPQNQADNQEKEAKPTVPVAEPPVITPYHNGNQHIDLKI